jgi:Ca-activated chloride channel family protein
MRTTTWVRVAVAGLLLAMVAAPAAQADQVKLNVALGKPFLLADKPQTAYLKVGLTGFEMKDEAERTPVNVAVVIDKSGSMSGEKIQKAKEAALMAIGKLSAKDIVSVVAYNHTVEVLLPATKVADKRAIRAAIQKLSAGGNTALFAGVSKGADELRKFLDKDRANRIILLSDGLANVGPSSVAQLGNLGSSLIKEGISVTTVGLGSDYNEDLMTELARRSDGNHAFVSEPADLARIFKLEFGDVLAVVAQEVVVKVACAAGIRPVRLLGRKGEIDGQTATTTLNQLTSAQEKYLLLEVEVPAGEENSVRDVATVSLSYLNMQTKTTDRLTSAMAVRFTKSTERVEKAANKDVLVAAVEQIGNDTNKRAVELRDQGKVKEAEKLLKYNAEFLAENASKLQSRRLKTQADFNNDNAGRLAGKDWTGERKRMRDDQLQRETQRAY